MIKHQVTVKDLTGYVSHRELASAFGLGSHKVLQVSIEIPTLRARYMVVSQGKIVYRGRSLKVAVKRYNQEK
jgi:hypothetical protein